MKKQTCSAVVNRVYWRCSRRAVVQVGLSPYCRQHALLRMLPVRFLPGVKNVEGLRKALVSEMFGEGKEEE